MKNLVRFLIFSVFLFFFGCSNNHFVIYSIDGHVLDELSSKSYSSSNFFLYFNKDDINKDFEEIYIISTDNFYYGQFFFDDIFMDILKNKAGSLNADAIIFEKNKKDYPNYNEDYLFFTAIRFKNNHSHSTILD